MPGTEDAPALGGDSAINSESRGSLLRRGYRKRGRLSRVLSALQTRDKARRALLEGGSRAIVISLTVLSQRDQQSRDCSFWCPFAATG